MNRKSRVVRIFLAILFCTIAGRAIAKIDINSGNFLLPYCKAAISEKRAEDLKAWDAAAVGRCEGLIEALRWVGSSIEGSNRFCPPEPSPIGQSLRVVILYMEQHPEQLHLDFKELALRALKQAWPCPK
jgi:hypothetical protein